MCLLDQTKTVAECALQLVYASKEAGGNPKATHAHPDVDDAADTMKETLQVGWGVDTSIHSILFFWKVLYYS